MPELENPFAGHQATRQTGRGPAWVALVIAVIATAVAVTAVVALQSASEKANALGAQVQALQGQISSLQESILATEQRLQIVETSPAPTSVATAPATVNLPRFPQNGPDPALGMTLGDVTGVFYADGNTHTIDPADGKARAWLIWAHWCPYCQRELPDVKAWYEEQAAAFTHMEVVSITTAMDESRGNPLIPYLEDQQLPFPVITDTSGDLAVQFGVSAFPFWVFTGPDGTVLGRTAGLLPEEQMRSFFEQLEAEGASAAAG